MDGPEVIERLRRIEEALSSRTAGVGAVSNTGTVNTAVEGDAVELNTKGRSTLSVSIEGGAGADFEIDGSIDGLDWHEGDVLREDVTELRETFNTGERHVRVRVETAAQTSQQAEITLSASGG